MKVEQQGDDFITIEGITYKVDYKNRALVKEENNQQQKTVNNWNTKLNKVDFEQLTKHKVEVKQDHIQDLLQQEEKDGSLYLNRHNSQVASNIIRPLSSPRKMETNDSEVEWVEVKDRDSLLTRIKYWIKRKKH